MTVVNCITMLSFFYVFETTKEQFSVYSKHNVFTAVFIRSLVSPWFISAKFSNSNEQFCLSIIKQDTQFLKVAYMILKLGGI